MCQILEWDLTCDAHLKKILSVLPKKNSSCRTNDKNQTQIDIRATFY